MKINRTDMERRLREYKAQEEQLRHQLSATLGAVADLRQGAVQLQATSETETGWSFRRETSSTFGGFGSGVRAFNPPWELPWLGEQAKPAT